MAQTLPDPSQPVIGSKLDDADKEQNHDNDDDDADDSDATTSGIHSDLLIERRMTAVARPWADDLTT
jgi:hypothetical protein